VTAYRAAAPPAKRPPPTPSGPRAFTDQDIQRARQFLNKSGGADWTAVKRQTIHDDDEARRIGLRLMARLQTAGLAASLGEATGLMFELIRRVRRDIAVAQQIRAMLGAGKSARTAP